MAIGYWVRSDRNGGFSFVGYSEAMGDPRESEKETSV
jgi:hypothetical protein